jgi:outer membrane protein assembly factor BamB
MPTPSAFEALFSDFYVMKVSFTRLIILIGSMANLSSQLKASTPLWSFTAAAPIDSSPAIAADGTIYVASSLGGSLYAITKAGSNKWTFPLPPRLSSSPALAADGTIYIANAYFGYLYAINPDGSPRWTNTLSWEATFPLGSSPAIGANNALYVRGSSSWLFAVSSNGTTIWSRSVGGIPSVVLGPDATIYTGTAAVTPDGTQEWTTSLPGAQSDSPAIAQDGTIYATGNWLYAFSADGTNLWINNTNYFLSSSPAVGQDGTIYIATFGGGTLCAISPSGVLRWQTAFAPNNPTNAPSPAVPAIDTAGTIYYPVFNALYAVSPAGSIQWTFSPGDGSQTQTSPAIGPDGTIYVTFGSKLYAIAGTNALANAPWPMYRQNARHTGKVEKPSLMQPQKRSDASFEFQLYGQVGQTFTVESTTNFNTWTSLTSFVATTLPMPVTDTTATNAPAKFYRAFTSSQ